MYEKDQFVIKSIIVGLKGLIVKAKKQLVMVVAMSVPQSAGRQCKISRGIDTLSKINITEYINTFLQERGIHEYSLHRRGLSGVQWATNPMVVCDENDPRTLSLITYDFRQFPISDFDYFKRELSKEELDRDSKKLKRILK